MPCTRQNDEDFSWREFALFALRFGQGKNVFSLRQNDVTEFCGFLFTRLIIGIGC
jgi:hypothetical protein